MLESVIRSAYEAARAGYAALGVDTEAALQKLDTISISLHCWQGDDVTGLETASGGVSGGILSTGNHPGKARNGDELRADLGVALENLPGPHKVNLHASYAETGGEKTDRDAYTPRHFSAWIDWAVEKRLGLDFNPTFFGHPMCKNDLTLANPDKSVRDFWIAHAKACRAIAAEMGHATGQVCINNLWIGDGMKDMTADRGAFRARLKDALDEIYAASYDPALTRDAVECKLFGIGSESFVVGSHEFYMGYAGYAREKGKQLMLALDMGHFHPTELVSDKISSMLLFWDEILLHVSRGVRWDSDHVVVTSDELCDVMRELARADGFGRAHIALDFFDGSINRVAAWVIGARAARKAVLAGLLDPTAMLRDYENAGDYSSRLALMDEARTLPLGAVWNYYCLTKGKAAGMNWLGAVKKYEADVQSKRIQKSSAFEQVK